MNKKGVEISMNMIIVAAIGLLVLVVLSVILLGKWGIFGENPMCEGEIPGGDTVCNGMSLSEAAELCNNNNIPTNLSFAHTAFMEDTKTWWLTLDIKKEGCNPACVVNTETKEAEINWRCIGALVETSDNVNLKIDQTETTDKLTIDLGCGTLDGVIFIYSDTCPHCKIMKPIVEELELQYSLDFHWVENSDKDGVDYLVKCYKDVLTPYVPQFICANVKNETIIGSMAKEKLEWFALRCNNDFNDTIINEVA